MFRPIKNHMIFSYKNETFEPRITLRPNGSNSESDDTNFITRTSHASKKASMNIKSLTNNASNTWSLPHHIAKTLSFFVDASFDQTKRKWFWSNGIEIQADHWDYKCNTHPHQPATEFAVTISDKGTLLYQIMSKSLLPRGDEILVHLYHNEIIVC